VKFDGDDKILTLLNNGIYELTSFDLNNHFDDRMLVIEKYDPSKVYTAIHLDGKTKNYMVKRFLFDATPIGKQTSIISDENGSKLILITGNIHPIATITQLKGKDQIAEIVEIDLTTLIDVKGMKAMGNRLSQFTVKNVEFTPDPPVSKGDQNNEYRTEESQSKSPDTDLNLSADEDNMSAPQTTITSDSQTKKIDLEITNPNDIEIDNKGQLGLF